MKRGLHAAGSVLAVVAVVFVGLRLQSYWLAISMPHMTLADWGAVACLALTYGAANGLLALAWWHVLRHLGTTVSRRCAIRLYGVSNLAKYVPGNIFHLAGRQALGMAAGIPAATLARSMAWELGLIALGGAMFGWISLTRWMPGMSHLTGLILALSSVGLMAAGLGRFAGRQMMLAFVWQVLFLLLSGLVFTALTALLNERQSLGLSGCSLLVGAYVTAWLVGLVTPGAPAGVGVREVILLFLLRGLVSEETLVMAVLLGRLVTVVGDLSFFTVAACIAPKRCLSTREYV